MTPRWRWGERWELLLLAVVAALVFTHSGDVRELVAVARETRGLFQGEEDFYRALPVLGPEYPLLRRLREHPPGTRVSVQGRGRFVARAQRFWLALLPTYPIGGDGELVICPEPCAAPDDVVLERGGEFVLLRRGGPRPGAS